jgi:hypothetical protein
VSHGRYVAFQMAEVAIPKNLCADILRLIVELRPAADAAPAYGVQSSCFRAQPTGEMRLDDKKSSLFWRKPAGTERMKSALFTHKRDGFALPREPNLGRILLIPSPIWGMSDEHY